MAGALLGRAKQRLECGADEGTFLLQSILPPIAANRGSAGVRPEFTLDERLTVEPAQTSA